MTYIDVEQNTEQWDELRIAKITSSKLGLVMANFGKPFGEPAKKYAIDIATEQITGRKAGGGYSNEHMDRGHEQEPLARMLYEETYFCEVTNGGFYDLGDYGCSPDGHVNDDGLIEIKSSIPSVHYERIRKQCCDSSTYKWQMIGNLKASGKQWIDFVSYCQDFPIGKQLYVIKYTADKFAKEYEMIDARLDEFRKLIKESKEVILNSNYYLNY